MSDPLEIPAVALPGKPEGATCNDRDLAMSLMPPRPAITTEWADVDEKWLHRWAKMKDNHRAARFAREILRLRAERDEARFTITLLEKQVNVYVEQARYWRSECERLSSPSAPDTRSPSGTGPSAQDWKTLYELEVRSTERRERTDALMAKLDLGDCGLEQGVERQCGHLLEAEEAGEAETL